MLVHFSILRLLFVAAIFAAAFGVVRPTRPRGILSALLVAIPVSALVLAVRVRDVVGIIRSLLSCGLGAFVALLFCPMIHPPYEPGDEFRYMIGGAIVGWVIGLLISPQMQPGETQPIEASGSHEDPVAHRRARRKRFWKIIAPVVVFLAGPAVGFIFWGIDVCVFRGSLFAGRDYQTPALMGALSVGVLVGFVAGIIEVLRLLPPSR